MPKTAMHDTPAPRIALIHTGPTRKNEGWYRIAFDKLNIPYDYVADQKLKTMTDLRSKYDVIVFGPVGGSAQSIVNVGRWWASQFRLRGRRYAESGGRSGHHRRYAAGYGLRGDLQSATSSCKRAGCSSPLRERDDFRSITGSWRAFRCKNRRRCMRAEAC